MSSTGIIVLGMHRSGTSACAGLLHLHGAYLGEVLDSQPDNPKGFWENKDATLLDDEVLHFLGCRWDWLWIFPEEWLDRIPDKFVRRRDTLITEFSVNPVWALKDPRMCLLWPWWQAGLASMDCQVKALLCLRHPMQVAQSLAKRNQMETSQALLLWAQHVLLAELHSREMQRGAVFYDEILGSPAQTISHIENELQITFPIVPEQHVLDDFISGDLRHHLDRNCPDTAIGCLCQEIFTACHEKDIFNQPKKWDIFRERFTALLQEDKSNRLQWAMMEVLRLEDTRIEQDRHIQEQDAAIGTLNAQIAERDAQIAERDAQIAERDAQIAERDAQIAERDARITERDIQADAALLRLETVILSGKVL